MEKETSKITILVVDDDDELRHAIASDLKNRGLAVLEASGGREGLEILRENPVDVLLTDVRMPDGDGAELLAKAKAMRPGLPVMIFVTGFADLSPKEAYDRGADAVFSKPFDHKALTEAVMKSITGKNGLWAEPLSHKA